MLDDKINKLQSIIDESEKLVFFSGAGVSTESGIKDFRSKDGLYSEKFKYKPEYMLSSGMFFNHMEEFYEFYKEKMNSLDREPNVTHKFLKSLEDSGKTVSIVTQNIDGLHSKVGSKNVYEIHGSIDRNYCLSCGKKYDGKFIFSSKGVPTCECSGVIKPDVVLYGEMLPEAEYMGALKAISEADALIVIGTSLTVELASSMIRSFSGKYSVIINRDQTPYDSEVALVINDSLKNIFSKLKVPR